MLMKSLLTTCLLLFVLNLNTQELPFKKGEKLTYRVHYGLMNAGIATIELQNKNYTVHGKPAYRAVGIGKSGSFFDWFFKVRDRYETYFSPTDLEALKFVRRINEGGYKKEQDYIFYPEKKQVDIGSGKMMDLPGRKIQDMVSAFYFARALDFSGAKKGDVFTIPIFLDEEYVETRIKYLGVETIDSDVGKLECMKFVPVVQKGRIFKDEEDLLVWITNDKNKIPVRAQAKILVGSVKMDLKGYKGLKYSLKK